MRVPSGFVTPAVETSTFSAKRKMPWRPARIGTSSRVMVPSWFGSQPTAFRPPPSSFERRPESTSVSMLPSTVPFAPESTPASVAGTQLPSGVQTPDVQSALTRQFRAASSLHAAIAAITAPTEARTNMKEERRRYCMGAAPMTSRNNESKVAAAVRAAALIAEIIPLLRRTMRMALRRHQTVNRQG